MKIVSSKFGTIICSSAADNVPSVPSEAVTALEENGFTLDEYSNSKNRSFVTYRLEDDASRCVQYLSRTGKWRLVHDWAPSRVVVGTGLTTEHLIDALPFFAEGGQAWEDYYQTASFRSA